MPTGPATTPPLEPLTEPPLTPLTREALASDDFLARLGLPEGLTWTREAIARSLADTLRQRPPGPLWVFAYGSLMWNPLFDFAAREPARLDGWHRSFCLRLLGGRATPAQPGRMLALERGGCTHGLALQLHEAQLDQELQMLWMREMPTGAYHPCWVELTLTDRRVPALAFVIDTQGPGYLADASVRTVAPLIAAARGPLGSNADYVLRLAGALADCGLEDPYVQQLTAALQSPG